MRHLFIFFIADVLKNHVFACFCKHQYSRGKVVAANHVPQTQRRLIVTSCMRYYVAYFSLRHVLRHGKLPYATHTHLQHLFYFIANVCTAKIKENKCDIKVSSCNIYFYFILDAQFVLDEQYQMAEIKYLCIYASTQI